MRDMHVTLYPDAYSANVEPITRQALSIINSLTGLDNDHIDHDIDVVDGSRCMVSAIVALLDMLYDWIDLSHDAIDADLVEYLRAVATTLAARPPG